MNSNDGKDVSNIVQHFETVRRSAVESLMALNRMDYHAAELHFLTMDKGVKELNVMLGDFKRALEERKHQS